MIWKLINLNGLAQFNGYTRAHGIDRKFSGNFAVKLL